MKNVVLVLMAILFMLPNVAVASLPLENRPTLAVIVSGHSDPNVNRFLATELTRALARTERYREASRYEEFLSAVTAEQMMNEIHLAELAQSYGILQLGIVSMTSILGSYAITLKVVDVETGETISNGEVDNSLATLADIRVASDGLVGAIVGGTTPTSATPTQAAITPTPVYVVNAPAHTPTVAEGQQLERPIVNVDTFETFFAMKYAPILDGNLSLHIVNYEIGQIRGDAWWWSIDLSGGGENIENDSVEISRSFINLLFNIGPVWEFPNKMHYAFGVSVGFAIRFDDYDYHRADNESYREYGYIGFITRYRFNFVEVAYRGILMGDRYINQAMIGFHLSGNRRRQ